MQAQFSETSYDLRSDVDTPIPIPPGEDLPPSVKEPPDTPVLEPDDPVREPEPTEPTRL
jgi:hypothetical protein